MTENEQGAEPKPPAEKEGAAALNRAAEYAEDLKDPAVEKPKYGQPGVDRSEATLEREQDAKVRASLTVTRQTEGEEDAPAEGLNQDG